MKCHAKPSWFSHTRFPLQRRDGVAGHEEDKRVDLRNGHKSGGRPAKKQSESCVLIALAEEREGSQGFCSEVHCGTS